MGDARSRIAQVVLLGATLLTSSVYADTSVKRLEAQADVAAAKHGVPAELLKAIAQRESNWNPKAVGASGEIGLTQLKPATVLAFIYGKNWRADLPMKERLYMIERELFAPHRNLHLAGLHLKQLLKESHGDVGAAIAGWNGGPGVTRYVVGVKKNMEKYEINKPTDGGTSQ